MQKYFMVEQPPIFEKYRLIVDDINDYETVAYTADIDKVLYNRRILGQALNIHLETYTALSDKGISVVLPIGRYVTVWEISKDEKTQHILYVDYDTDLSFSKLFGDRYSQDICDEFERIQNLTKASFKEDDDRVELVTANT